MNCVFRVTWRVGFFQPTARSLQQDRDRLKVVGSEMKMEARMISKFVRIFFVAIAVLVLVLFPTISHADKITDWNANAHTLGAGGIILAAYLHIAMYDAVNAIDGGYSPFAISLVSVPEGASQEAAAVSAAYQVLKLLVPPAQLANLDAAYAASLATIPDGQSKEDGIVIGADVAAQFMALRQGDGLNAPIVYVPGSGPGAWQPTPPAFAPAVNAWLPYFRPFGILSASQFRAEGPPALTSKQYAEDFNETKRLGKVDSLERTAEQTEIGLFHTENPGLWTSRNFRNFAATQNLSLADSARLFAMLYVSAADALVAGFDSKFFYGFWRPVTAIPAADTDGNPDTEADALWTPLAITPSHPEYPAAHAFGTTAWVEALRYFFGTKSLDITLDSTVTGTSHAFHNTDDIIKEVTEARIYGGMHFRTALAHGIVIGKKVAHYIAKHYFQPIQ